jgi:hypothetical protein
MYGKNNEWINEIKGGLNRNVIGLLITPPGSLILKRLKQDYRPASSMLQEDCHGILIFTLTEL